jgi:ribosomal protein L37AE/L43A
MATQICPHCKANAFTWSLNKEESPLTKWQCRVCGYMAYEDENQLRVCHHCGQKTEARLQDGVNQYWWCSHCNSVSGVVPV